MRFSGKILDDSLLKNALFLMMSQVSNLSTGFIFWIIAARFYSASDIGMISALLSAMMLLGSIGSLGFNTSIMIYLPSDHEKAGKIINSCITVTFVASLVISLVFILGLGIWASSLKPVLTDTGYIFYFLLITCASSVSSLINSAFVAGRRSSFQTIKDFSFGLTKIFPLPLLAGFGAIGIYQSWGIGVFLSIILGYFLLPVTWKGFRPVVALDPVIRKMYSLSAGNYLAGIFSSIPRLALPIMIANSISTEAAGYYYIAMVVAGLMFGIPQAISSSLLAEASNSGELWKNVGKSIKFSVLLLIPGLLIFIILGKYILHLFNPVFGENAFIPLILLSIASIPLAVCSIFTTVRNSEKKIKSVVVINAFTAVITLIFAYPLMKMYGITGAAAAFLIGNTISAAVVILTMKDPRAFINRMIFK